MTANRQAKRSVMGGLLSPAGRSGPVCVLLLLTVVESGAASRLSAVSTPLPVKPGTAGFTLMEPVLSGVTFQNRLAQQRHLTNQILLNGSGVAAGDVDGDGLVDLYFCALDGPNVLYRNLGGWRFEDVTSGSGVACPELDASGAALADLDGDGDLDLLVASLAGGTHLFFNDGHGHFTGRESQVLNRGPGSTSIALADIDGNGTLDLYVANYRAVTLRDQPNTEFKLRMVNGHPEVTSINGRPVTEPDLAHRFEFKIDLQNGRQSFASDENGEPDLLALNDGQGRFTPLSFTNGAFLDEDGQPLRLPPFDWGLSVVMRDLNGDGAPDIYVCNDFKSPDRIWINDGRGTFRALPRMAIRQTSFSSMGVDVADINRDGHFDIFVVDMLSRDHRQRLSQRSDFSPDYLVGGDGARRVQSSRNTLQLARGDGTFAEIAQFAGLAAADWAWSPIFLDVDLDGFEDLLITNGFERDGMNVDVQREIEARKAARKFSAAEQLGLRKLFPRLATPNAAFRNLGHLRFADVSSQWGFAAREVSQGMALADLDGDGDLDVIVCNLNAPVALYRNNSGAPRVAVRLQGRAPNTRGIGAKITVAGGPVVQSQEMICGGRYLSCDDAMRVFAAGSLTNRLRIEVVWRDGKQTVVEDAPPNHLYVIEEPAGGSRPVRPIAPPPPMFQDLSHALGHRHVEDLFDDFVRQPLLAHKLSQAGPGLSWTDLNGDGWDDLVVSSGKGGRLAAFENDQRGGFRKREDSPFDQAVTRDQTAVLGWRASNDVVLLAGSSNYEDGLADGSAVRQYELVSRRILDPFPGQESSTGPLALADVDGDGTLDLFVGGRVRPGHYPEPASSRLFRGRGGGFVLDDLNAPALTRLGLVSGAVFSDLDGDGFPELILACEWGPLKILRNDHGRLSAWNPPVSGPALNPQLSTLNHLTGWWTSVATGDFDGDGRMDLLAGNWGENTEWEPFRSRPLRLYFAGVESDGAGEMIKAHYEPSMQGYVPLIHLDTALRGMPWLQPRFPTWKSWSESTVEQILGERAGTTRVLEANWLSTTVFLNRGDHFTAVRLPDEAQFAPVFGLGVADFDGDGNEDIFLSQNFFATAPGISRHDAGRGLLLSGDGRGGFAAVSGQRSGIAIHGEQRGAAVADFDQDGRVDLAVGQNGGETKLYRNVTAQPGLRVRLSGPPGNPDAVGAMIRLGDGTRFGPAREIHAGAGWLSQDSAVPVLAASGRKIAVRWPGGKTSLSEMPAVAKEIEVRDTGELKVRR